MRNIETIQIGEKEYTVKEMRVHEVIALFNQLEKGVSYDKLPEFIDDFCRNFVNGLSWGGVKFMAPSEIEKIWLKFQEVNRPFFQFAAVVGLTDVLAAIKNQFILTFMRHVSG